MHRLTYRNFGDHAALLLNHTVDVGSGRAGIRWYEVRDPLGAPTIYQQGTYAPNDSASRWMGSLAMDHTGNIALGYSVSSASIYPSIRYAGRLVDDPLGELAQGENSIVAGAGSQTDTLARWGDYSSMNLDPVDDCTFWYTQEYYPVTAPRNWHTRIASFRFPNCSTAASGVLRGAVRESVSNTLIPNSQIMISSSGGPVIPVNAPHGFYTLTLPANTYTLTASAYGYAPGVVDGVSVTANLTKTQDVLLNLSATYHCFGLRYRLSEHTLVCDADAGWRAVRSAAHDDFHRSCYWILQCHPGFRSILHADRFIAPARSASARPRRVERRSHREFFTDPHDRSLRRRHRLGAQPHDAAARDQCHSHHHTRLGSFH